MAFYDNSPWPPAPQQPTSQWDNAQQQSRHATASASAPDPDAFASQFEEIDRAIDNMIKSGSYMPAVLGPARHASPGMPGRFSGPFGHRLEYDNMRPAGPPYHNPYPNPRFHPDPDQMLQAKRRMAAQRERELRNYHQEQQYSRNSNIKPERSASPGQPNEADRRELLARQHRALYGKDASMYGGDSSGASGKIGPSSIDSAVQMPSRDAPLPDSDSRRASVSAGKVGMPAYGASDSATHSGARTAATSPLASPAIGSGGLPSLTASGIGAIGSRPGQPQPAVAKQSMTPKERSSSAASNPAGPQEKAPVFGAWGNSGVWGNGKGGLGVQTSVWG